MPCNEELENEERDLMKKNDLGELQQYRLERYNNSGRTNEMENDHQYMCALIDTEQSLRELVQKEEIALKELLKSQSQYEKERLNGKLQGQAREYWILEQTWWRSWREIKEAGGYLTRAFELWRSYPQWYLHRVLREDCAMRDGCCSRACGCCAKRATQEPYTSTRKLGVGHCTVECACCAKSRGFCLSGLDKPRVSGTARISGPYEDSRYANKIRDASIWGVVPGDSGHPLGQINDRPPAYIPKAVFKDLSLEFGQLSI